MHANLNRPFRKQRLGLEMRSRYNAKSTWARQA